MEPNKYSRGKIYRIYSLVSDDEYIGSTIQSLCERMAGHRKMKCVSTKEMFEKNGIENCRIVLLENYPCNSKEELLMRERYWVEQRDCINKRSPIRTTEEKVQYHKDWYITNKDRISTHTKVYREIHKEQVKERTKVYRKTHKEQIKEHYEEHKDKYNTNRNEKRFRLKHGVGLFCFGL